MLEISARLGAEVEIGGGSDMLGGGAGFEFPGQEDSGSLSEGNDDKPVGGGCFVDKLARLPVGRGLSGGVFAGEEDDQPKGLEFVLSPIDGAMLLLRLESVIV